MTNIHDVARRAQVSPITVSRVVNRKPNVSRATRERVLRAIAELNYVPDGVARSLRRRRSDVVALLVTDIRNPFFTTLARGAEDAARAAGLSLVLGDSDEDPAVEATYLRVIGERRVDGVILVPTDRAEPALQRYLPVGTPVVLVARRLAGVEADSVRCDHRAALATLCRHLLTLGHREIAIVGGPHGISTWEDRVAGYQDALRAAGLLPDPGLVIPGSFREESGTMAVRVLLERTRRPEAIIAGNSQVALGVLNELAAQGLRVPEEMAVASVDDPLPRVQFGPCLTVVEQPVYEMGKAAVELLLGRIRGARAEPEPWQVLFDARLRIGTSCGEALAAARRSNDAPAPHSDAAGARA